MGGLSAGSKAVASGWWRAKRPETDAREGAHAVRPYGGREAEGHGLAVPLQAEGG